VPPAPQEIGPLGEQLAKHSLRFRMPTRSIEGVAGGELPIAVERIAHYQCPQLLICLCQAPECHGELPTQYVAIRWLHVRGYRTRSCDPWANFERTRLG
jgi:hypothetical protein